jgi:hypothetical protein
MVQSIIETGDSTMKIAVENMNNFTKRFNNGGYPHLRFGQAFINCFFSNGRTDPELFYMVDRAMAEEYIWENYVDLESGWDD